MKPQAWAQWGLLILLILGVGIALARHGQPETGKHNFWIDALATGISAILCYYAGAFNLLF
jgi:hypothetical protein